jgi:D-amino-acid dehydrogenase
VSRSYACRPRGSTGPTRSRKPIASRPRRAGLRFLRECTSERARRNTLVKLRLCQYSQEKLDELIEKENVPHDGSKHGMLYLYREHEGLEQGKLQMQLLNDHGQEMEFLDAEGCARVEPALEHVKDRIAGAIYGVTDAAGDSKMPIAQPQRPIRSSRQSCSEARLSPLYALGPFR